MVYPWRRGTWECLTGRHVPPVLLKQLQRRNTASSSANSMQMPTLWVSFPQQLAARPSSALLCQHQQAETGGDEITASDRASPTMTLTTEPAAQYQHSGEGHAQQPLDAARANNVDMPTHDISTPRRLIGGRCRKWAVRTQQTLTNKRETACGKISPGEPRMQHWSNRQSQRASVHAHCIKDGVGPDHDLHPKLPTDQDAMNTVSQLSRTQRLRFRLLSSPTRPPPPIPSPRMTPCSTAKNRSASTTKS